MSQTQLMISTVRVNSTIFSQKLFVLLNVGRSKLSTVAIICSCCCSYEVKLSNVNCRADKEAGIQASCNFVASNAPLWPQIRHTVGSLELALAGVFTPKSQA